MFYCSSLHLTESQNTIWGVPFCFIPVSFTRFISYRVTYSRQKKGGFPRLVPDSYLLAKPPLLNVLALAYIEYNLWAGKQKHLIL